MIGCHPLDGETQGGSPLSFPLATPLALIQHAINNSLRIYLCIFTTKFNISSSSVNFFINLKL